MSLDANIADLQRHLDRGNADLERMTRQSIAKDIRQWQAVWERHAAK